MTTKKISSLSEFKEILAIKQGLPIDKVPDFCGNTSLEASTLLIFRVPNIMDPLESGVISILTENEPCQILREVFDKANINHKDVVVASLYAAYRKGKLSTGEEYKGVESLVALSQAMPNLKIVIGFGSTVWKSLYYVKFYKPIHLLSSPEPGTRNYKNPDDTNSLIKNLDSLKNILESSDGSPHREFKQKVGLSNQFYLRDKKEHVWKLLLKKRSWVVNKWEDIKLPPNIVSAKNEIKDFWSNTWKSK